mgnify:FL=1
MTITITDYQVNISAGTLTFREDAMRVKDDSAGKPFLRGSYTQVGETITLRIDELPRDLEVLF